MKELIFGMIYTLMGVLATYYILRDRRDKKSFMATLFSIAVMIVSGLYIPLTPNKHTIPRLINGKRFINNIKT